MSMNTMQNETEAEATPDDQASAAQPDEAKEDSGSELFEASEPIAAKKVAISWNMINFWLDALLGVVFLAGLWTAFVTRFVFPPPTTAEGWTLWGYTYNQWSDLTFVLLCILGGGIVVHVMLHWTWVCNIVTSRLLPRRQGKSRPWTDGVRTLVGVGLIVVILNVLGIAFAFATLSVQAP